MTWFNVLVQSSRMYARLPFMTINSQMDIATVLCKYASFDVCLESLHYTDCVVLSKQSICATRSNVASAIKRVTYRYSLSAQQSCGSIDKTVGFSRCQYFQNNSTDLKSPPYSVLD